MKLSVKVILMMFTMVFTVVFANAQPKGGKGKGKNVEERAVKQAERLQKDLGLNDVQTKKVSAINLAYAQKTKSIRDAARAEKDAGNEVDKEAKDEQIKSLREAQTAEIKTVLTPEQATKFDSIIEERKAKKKDKKGKKAKSKVKEMPNEEGMEEGDDNK